MDALPACNRKQIDSTMPRSMNMFTWKPIYSELARVLLAWCSRQGELIAILHLAKEQGVPVSALQDEDKKGKRFPLEVIDPFTFFAFFSRKTLDENRVKLLDLIKAKLTLTSALPTDFEGLPVMNPQKSWFFSYQKDRAAFNYYLTVTNPAFTQYNNDMYYASIALNQAIAECVGDGGG